jgi:hypothetical protein
VSVLIAILAATVAVPLSMLTGIALLAFPRRKQFAPYWVFVYPCAYAAAVIDVLVVGPLLLRPIDLFGYNEPTWVALILLLVWLLALLISVLLGGLVGLSIANRIWWRLFAQSDDFSERGGFLALTPPIRRVLEGVSGMEWILRKLGSGTRPSGATS